MIQIHECILCIDNGKETLKLLQVTSVNYTTVFRREGAMFFYPGAKPLNSDLVKRGSSRAGMGQAWLNECLKPFTNFQSGPFARAHRISAWPHGRSEHTLGKADTMQQCS